jgi:hypothetical protein
VEPVRRRQLALFAAATPHADVDIVETFAAARARLEDFKFDLVVTNLRLGVYNGIHLAYIVRLAGAPTHVLVHTGSQDVGAARDIQRAGALFERTERLVVTLPAYLVSTLPPLDRRDPSRSDRRRDARGGRRAWDRRSFNVDAGPIDGGDASDVDS